MKKNEFSSNLDYINLSDSSGCVIGYCNMQIGSIFHIHSHTVMEIYYIISGEGELFYRNKWIKAYTGRFYLFPAFTKHTARTMNPDGLQFMYYFNKGPFRNINYYIDKPLKIYEIYNNDVKRETNASKL